MSPDPEPEALEVRLVLEAIHARYGYDLRAYEPNSIRRRLQLALAKTGLAHLGELQHRLLHDPAFFSGVLQGLTVRTTELFREPACFQAFRSMVVPLLRTYPLIKLDVSSSSHPFYTGKTRSATSEDRAEKFKKKYAAFEKPKPTS